MPYPEGFTDEEWVELRDMASQVGRRGSFDASDFLSAYLGRRTADQGGTLEGYNERPVNAGSVAQILQDLCDLGDLRPPGDVPPCCDLEHGEPLGVDDAGREMVAYIDGTPGTRPWPPPILREQGVVAMAALTKQLHAAVATFRPFDPVWRIGPRAVQPGETVCHGDLGPWNTIWRDDQLVGLIDWDTAEPGSPLLDVASLALNLVPLRDDAYAAHAGFDGAAPRSKRFQVLCRTYGYGANPQDVLRHVGILHERELERTLRWGGEGLEPWATFLRRGDELEIRGSMQWLADHKDELLAAG